MTEAWRRKRYYAPRVLIDVDRVLAPTFPDSLVCLTGSDMEMLRNLAAYLHRRSTWVSEYHDGYYLAPTNEEWDELQTLIAELEDTLMGCTDITQALSDIAAQIACLCTAASSQPVYSPVTDDIVNYYVDNGGARHDDPYPTETVIDENRCAIAQLTWQGAYEWLTELIQPAQDKATDVLVPAVMVLIASWVGPAVFNIPTGMLLATLWNAIEVWEQGELENVANTLFSLKEEIVCALYDGLLVDARTASQAARAVIDEQDLAPLDKVCLGLLHSPWMIAACKTAWTGSTAWAVANVTPGYCAICNPASWPYYYEMSWPPCPGTWTGTFSCSVARSLPGINADYNGQSPEFTLPAIDKDIYVDFTVEWYSSKPAGWTVGYVTLQQGDGLGGWVNKCTMSCTNNVGAGSLCTGTTITASAPVTNNLFRFRIGGQGGQWDVNPYNFEPSLIVAEVYQVP